MNKDEMVMAMQGQLDLHFKKIQDIRLFNPDLAERIEKFTNVLIENNFKGVFDVDDDVYHNGAGIAQSRFNYLKKSTNKYHYNTYVNLEANLNRKRHFSEGDFIHRTLLEKGTVKGKFCDEAIALEIAWLAKPDAKKIRSTTAFKDQIKKLRDMGLEPIKKELFQSAHILEREFQNNPELKELMADSLKEKAVYSLCPVTGLIRKAKVDILKTFETFAYIGDLKSTRSIDEDKFDRSILDYNYHVQGAYYKEVVQDALGIQVKQHLIPLIENEAPFEIDLKFIDEPSMSLGKRDMLKYMKQLAKCYSENNFPRRKITLKSCGIPEWKLAKELLEMES